jgi:hypothetical protein
MRPRFEMTVSVDPDRALERLRDHLDTSGCPCRGDVYERQVEVRICEREHHTWSPGLNVLLDETDEGGARLRGTFGPNPSVWTMFMAGYAVSGMTMGTGLLVLSSQMMLRGEERWGGWLLLAGVVGCALVYGLARIGQRLAAPQMEMIRDTIAGAFPDDRIESEETPVS